MLSDELFQIRQTKATLKAKRQQELDAKLLEGRTLQELERQERELLKRQRQEQLDDALQRERELLASHQKAIAVFTERVGLAIDSIVAALDDAYPALEKAYQAHEQLVSDALDTYSQGYTWPERQPNQSEYEYSLGFQRDRAQAFNRFTGAANPAQVLAGMISKASDKQKLILQAIYYVLYQSVPDVSPDYNPERAGKEYQRRKLLKDDKLNFLMGGR